MDANAVKISLNDFHKICRVCLLQGGENMRAICCDDISEPLTRCTGVRITNHDQLPEHICEQCYEMTLKFDNFRALVRNSNSFLRGLLKLERDMSAVVKQKSREADEARTTTGHSLNSYEKYECDTSSQSLRLDAIPSLYTSDDTIAATLIKNEVIDDNSSMSHLQHESVSSIVDDCDRISISETGSNHSVQPSGLSNDNAITTQSTEIAKTTNLNKDAADDENTLSILRLLKCVVCQNQCRTFHELKVHVKKVHKTRVRFKCSKCPRSFSSPYVLSNHQKSHTSYACATCARTFPKRSVLAKHEQIHKVDREIYFCNTCSCASFYSIYSLRKHMRNKHSTEPVRKEVCSICGKAVKSLRGHVMIVHTKSRPHKCDTCDKAFFDKYSLRTHIKVKHEGIIERKSMCSVCGMAFKTQAHLRRHMGVHSDARNYACQLCERTYKKQMTLDRHMKVHANIRPHACQYCRKAFHTRTMLNIHVRTHTGERPYACNLCDSTFTYSYALKTHMKGHAG